MQHKIPRLYRKLGFFFASQSAHYNPYFELSESTIQQLFWKVKIGAQSIQFAKSVKIESNIDWRAIIFWQPEKKRTLKIKDILSLTKRWNMAEHALTWLNMTEHVFWIMAEHCGTWWNMGKDVHQNLLKQQNRRFKTWQNISEHLFRNIASWQIMAKHVFQTLEEYGRPWVL